MAIIELDEEIKYKLIKTFQVSKEEIDYMLNFFRDKLKPEIKYRYLSHLVSTLEDIINTQEKDRVLNDIKTIKKNKNYKEKKVELEKLENILNSKNYRLFVITLIPTTKSRKNATTRIIKNNAMIYYNNNLTEKEKRLLIAHELGHIVEHFIFKNDSSENIASLFAFIAMLDKNKFYKEDSSNYIFKNDIEILNELAKVLYY